MTLSVVIVNYNVKYFLEQCLISVFRALRGIDAEVFVVDNASADGSCQMVRKRFPQVVLIENKQNYGFSYANNQAMRVAKGEFVLLLNPDTVVEEDTFSKCIAFMQKHPDAGSLSVKMIDGKGNFLPESKRALPSPMVSFYKIFGLSQLFPRSKTFARYHLGHLNKDEINEIEILPGAFMFMRKTALDKVGLLDEEFFMYGEDIDLSYRILKGGYKNYYFPETTIIHYKGESTKKGSINYVLVFYRAMMIFARKHFSRKNASLYVFLIYLAIYFRAGLSLLRRFASRFFQPAVDALLMGLGFAIIIPAWENFRFHRGNVYPDQWVVILSVSYVLVWLVSNWLSGAYDKPQRLFAASKGVAVGTLVVLAMYALLPNDVRFSRAIILLNAAWSIVLVQLAHILIGYFKGNVFRVFQRRKRIAIVGTPSEVNRVLKILDVAGADTVFVGQISPSETITHNDQIATIKQLPDVVRVNKINELIFCSGEISSQEIIKNMLKLLPDNIDYKIAPPDSLSIIGSNSIDTSGDLYTIDFSAISKPHNRRNKRLFDIGLSLFVLLFSPLLVLFVKRFGFLISKAMGVFFGRYTWVGYAKEKNVDISGLPFLREGVFSPTRTDNKAKVDSSVLERLNILYAKNYSVATDFSIIWSNLWKH
ncbi:MAG: glycosyltransferase [Bacteroidales bacterium]